PGLPSRCRNAGTASPARSCRPRSSWRPTGIRAAKTSWRTWTATSAAAGRICGSSAPFSAPRGRANAMTIHQSFANVSRRDFLKETAAGLTFACALAADPLRVADALADEPLAANAWVTIATDGTITIVSPAAEMGQGSFTSLPAILAEELDADWAKVKPVLPPEWDEKKYGNPGFGGTFQTSASASV